MKVYQKKFYHSLPIFFFYFQSLNSKPLIKGRETFSIPRSFIKLNSIHASNTAANNSPFVYVATILTPIPTSPLRPKAKNIKKIKRRKELSDLWRNMSVYSVLPLNLYFLTRSKKLYVKIY